VSYPFKLAPATGKLPEEVSVEEDGIIRVDDIEDADRFKGSTELPRNPF
jgi:hypothetical protein